MSEAKDESKHGVATELAKIIAGDDVAPESIKSVLTGSASGTALDAADPLKDFRKQFHIPHNPIKGTPAEYDSIYLCGNSLGLQPKRTQTYLMEELTKWRDLGVEGHFEGKRPWATIDETVTSMAAALVGAECADEVAVMNSLSVNLHLLLISFYRPTADRFKIFIEDGAFCSDYHVVKSQIQLHGYDPDTALISIKPREGETYLRTEDIIKVINEQGSSIATVLFPGVQFYTGQRFDLEAITKAASAQGCKVGFDLAHAAGNVPLKLHDWGVDFAAWCSYKYLNAGPGCIAGAFVHSKHKDASFKDQPRLSGWWGQELKNRFAMDSVWRPKAGAQSYQLSNPPVVAVVCLQGALEVHTEATMEKLRNKSRLLTGYLEYNLRACCDVLPPSASFSSSPDASASSKKIAIKQLTPTDPEARGCQISLLFNCNVEPINKALLEHGVICDVRKPNVLRVSPTPLYNTFQDVWNFVRTLRRVVDAIDAQTASQ